ncbi:hypothetical protein [Sodalis sp. C49]|uniref:hypothetical protein n=1 Tax=Sodalis sp. C49 TaxID=3228929 RepID=UPI003965C540
MLSYKKERMVSTFACVACFLIAVFFLFYTQFRTGFELLLGERFDGIIETSILQHWYNTFLGRSHWNDVGYFHPYTDTLGYNDGYFIYGVIYSFFRVLGFDIFLSSEFVNLTVKAIGYFSFYLLGRIAFNLKASYAILGALLFTLANSLVIQAPHAQLLSIAFSPLLTLLIFEYVQHLFFLNNNRQAFFYGSAAALLLSAWLITAFYMAWFYIFFTCTTFFFYALLLFLTRNDRAKIKFCTKFYKIGVIIPFGVFIISAIPFILVYMPKIKETGGHYLSSALIYAPSIANILDPSNSNFLFGDLSNYIFRTFFPQIDRTGEFQVGFPPFILISTICAVFYFNKVKKSSFRNIFYASVAISIIFSILLIVKVNERSLWEFVWRYVPGAKGMRVTARYALFLIFPISLIATLYLAKQEAKLPKFVIFIAASILILEQINISPNQNLHRSTQLAFIESVPTPPEACKAFFVTGQRPGEYPVLSDNIILDLYPHNVDAMFISELFALRTINGFSTFNPKDWDFKLSPYDTYTKRVLAYARRNHVEDGLCEYDLYSSHWSVNPFGNLPGLIKIKGNELAIELIQSPSFDIKTKEWQIKLQVTNSSNRPIGLKTFIPVNLGVRELNNDGSILKTDFLRVPIPYIAAQGGSAAITVTIPASKLSSNIIDILPVQENVSWLDAIGIQPLVINLRQGL